MDDAGRSFPASAGRKGAAARAGVFPRSRLLSGGVVLLGGALILSLAGGGLWSSLLAEFTSGLEGAMDKGVDPGQAALDALAAVLRMSLPVIVLVLLVGVLATALPALIAGRKGTTSAPLPDDAEPRGARAVLELLSLLAFGVLAVRIIAGSLPSFSVFSVEEMEGTVPAAGELVVAIPAAAGIVMCLAGLADLAHTRATIWRRLALTRSEAERESGRAGARARSGGGR